MSHKFGRSARSLSKDVNAMKEKSNSTDLRKKGKSGQGMGLRNKMIINIGELVFALSGALDLASPFLVDHQRKVAFIVEELADAASLDKHRTRRSVIAALFHDVGALSLEHKIQLRLSEVENIDQH